jgi:hypothetical protein
MSATVHTGLEVEVRRGGPPRCTCSLCRTRYQRHPAGAAWIASSDRPLCDPCAHAHGACPELRQAREAPITSDELARARREQQRDASLARLEPDVIARLMRLERAR